MRLHKSVVLIGGAQLCFPECSHVCLQKSYIENGVFKVSAPFKIMFSQSDFNTCMQIVPAFLSFCSSSCKFSDTGFEIIPVTRSVRSPEVLPPAKQMLVLWCFPQFLQFLYDLQCAILCDPKQLKHKRFSLIICFRSLVFVTFEQVHGAWISLQNMHGFFDKSIAVVHVEMLSLCVSFTKHIPTRTVFWAKVSVSLVFSECTAASSRSAIFPTSVIGQPAVCGDELSDSSLCLNPLYTFPITRFISRVYSSASIISETISSSSSIFSNISPS